MELLEKHWDWIASNPWGFVTISALIFGAGWGLAKLYYSERIELLKMRANDQDRGAVKKKPAAAFRYQSNGRHGRNVLADTTHDAVVGDHMSFQAEVPEGEKLHIALHGPPPESLGDVAGAWYFMPMGAINWTHSDYQESTSSPSQHFNAVSGPAEMKFYFSRPGDVLIEAFEGGSRKPSWSKKIRVSAKDR